MVLLLIVSGALGYYAYLNFQHDVIIPFTQMYMYNTNIKFKESPLYDKLQ